MNLEVGPELNHSEIRKEKFPLQNSRKDGLILQVHHTISRDNGEMDRVRFLHAAFDETDDIFAAADHRGNVFIIDLANEKYWQLPNVGSCTVITFPPTKKRELLFGTTSCSVRLINIDAGNVTGTLTGHTVPPTQATFSSTGQYCITTAAPEAKIWDLDSNSLAYHLSLEKDVFLKQAVFIPMFDNILACFQDDAICIWEFSTFNCLQKIFPRTWNVRDLKSIAFTRNGKIMVIGGHCQVLVAFSVDTWNEEKVIKLPEDLVGVRHIEFVPQPFDGGGNKILALLSSQSTLHFMDIESSLFLNTVLEPLKNIDMFTSSYNGKHIACILPSGEVNIYNSFQLLEVPEVSILTEVSFAEQDYVKPDNKGAAHHRAGGSSKQTLHKLREQMKQTLGLSRLLPILKEYGEYPTSYRSIIWRTILQIPYNQPAYMNLVERQIHPAYLHLEEKYPLENRSILKNLRRLLSCLAHWSSLFSEVKFLPLFVFPFVRVFQNDPLACFEAVATIILNWCQYWFEYFPFPPINVLSMIENVLEEHDSELLEFFYEAKVKTDLYAWTLLEAVFSEVLSRSDWLCLWDHVLSNEPSFLLMAVVAYNIICRRTLMSCQAHDDFEYFFHNQNPIDMKRFISKTYMLCNKTRKEVHPRQYLAAFKPLEKDSYPVFNQYPKLIIDNKVQRSDQIRKEEENILKEYETAMKHRAEQEKRMREAVHAEIQEERLKELEDVYQETLRKEEDRLAEQRWKVLALRKTLKTRELELLNAARDRLMSQNVQQRRIALNQLIDDIERKRAQEEIEIAAAEEEILQHHLELLSHKHNLEQKLSSYGAVPPLSADHRTLQQQQEQLADELRKLRKESASERLAKQVDITTRLAMMEELSQRSEMELTREVAERQHNFEYGQDNVKVMQLETETKKLEQEVEHLLEQMAGLNRREGAAHLQEVILSQAERRALNTEQEKFVKLRQHFLSSNLAHQNLDNQPDQPRQQEQDGEPKQQERTVPSEAETSLYIPVRSSAFYRQELAALEASMAVRDQIASESNFHYKTRQQRNPECITRKAD